MKIVVCVKVSKNEINPFDESALECALRMSDDVTVVSMAPKSAEKVLQPLTRIGAKVILISDSIYAGSDTLATAYILSEAIKKIGYDMVICGRQSIDGDTAQVGPMLSQMLGIRVITNVLEVNNTMAVTRKGEEEIKTPSLLTVERSYILRFPSIFSKMGEVEILNNNDLGCNPEKCGLSGSPTRVLRTFENEKGKRKCKFISMNELDVLIAELKNRSKKIETTVESENKLKSVWAVGSEVVEKAKEIADEVILIEKSSPEMIAQRAKEENPDVILWNADLWGRCNAPIVAAMLNTGLCADCTQLETDGEGFYMYRPAQGGNITAKIKCLTKPQMATVRTKAESSDIIVSGGKGVKDKIDELYALADKHGGEVCASRGLVDMGKADYSLQVGLTGKTVSPKIYIAIGISGAVHHTCAIENADTVIAINPDKDARIFEYADYGIISKF